MWMFWVACTDPVGACVEDRACDDGWTCGADGRCLPPAGPPPATADTAPPPMDTGATDPGPVVDPTCTTNGCLRAVTALGRYDRATLAPLVSPGVQLDNGYALYTMEYATEGQISTATVTLPIDLEGSMPPDGFPVVVNNHGSVGLDDPCQLSGTVSGAGLAGLFGARGTIGVAPDHPGLGTPGLQAYMDSASEGASALDAIRGALDLAALEGVAANGRAALVGTSQGGHTTFAAAARHSTYAPELDIRAFGAAAPSSLFEEHWAPSVDVAGSHLALFAMLAYSFAADASVDDAGVWAPGLGGAVDALMAEQCLWNPDPYTPATTLYESIPVDPTLVFSPAFTTAFSTGQWQGFSFMAAAFDLNRIRPFPQTAPIAIWQGERDTTVFPYMTDELVAALAAGGVTAELHAVPLGDHDTTAFGYLAFPQHGTDDSIAWILGHLGAP